jgi:hypothetical protein
MPPPTPQKQLDGFIAKYTPAVAKAAKAALEKMRKRLPGAIELVYENYNYLAIGFSPTEKASDCVFSIALYPRWISLFFNQAENLPDPRKLLQGEGKTARHIVLETPDVLDRPAVRELMILALDIAKTKMPKEGGGKIVIKSISEKQKPRRPDDKPAASVKPAKAKSKATRTPAKGKPAGTRKPAKLKKTTKSAKR